MDKYHKLNKNEEKYVSDLYHNPKSAVGYSNPYALYKYIKKENKYKNITLSQVKKWLQTQDSYTLFKEPRNINKHDHRFIPETINSNLDADIAHIPDFGPQNKGYTKFIAVFDIFSKKAYTELIKDQKADTIVEGLEKI